jgi:hypothetical protein
VVKVGAAHAENQITRAGAKRGQARAGEAGQPAHCPGHKSRRRLVTGQNKLNLVLCQRLDQIYHFAAGMAEHLAHPSRV